MKILKILEYVLILVVVTASYGNHFVRSQEDAKLATLDDVLYFYYREGDGASVIKQWRATDDRFQTIFRLDKNSEKAAGENLTASELSMMEAILEGVVFEDTAIFEAVSNGNLDQQINRGWTLDENRLLLEVEYVICTSLPIDVCFGLYSYEVLDINDLSRTQLFAVDFQGQVHLESALLCAPGTGMPRPQIQFSEGRTFLFAEVHPWPRCLQPQVVQHVPIYTDIYTVAVDLTDYTTYKLDSVVGLSLSEHNERVFFYSIDECGFQFCTVSGYTTNFVNLLEQENAPLQVESAETELDQYVQLASNWQTPTQVLFQMPASNVANIDYNLSKYDVETSSITPMTTIRGWATIESNDNFIVALGNQNSILEAAAPQNVIEALNPQSQIMDKVADKIILSPVGCITEITLVASSGVDHIPVTTLDDACLIHVSFGTISET